MAKSEELTSISHSSSWMSPISLILFNQAERKDPETYIILPQNELREIRTSILGFEGFLSSNSNAGKPLKDPKTPKEGIEETLKKAQLQETLLKHYVAVLQSLRPLLEEESSFFKLLSPQDYHDRQAEVKSLARTLETLEIPIDVEKVKVDYINVLYCSDFESKQYVSSITLRQLHTRKRILLLQQEMLKHRVACLLITLRGKISSQETGIDSQFLSRQTPPVSHLGKPGRNKTSGQEPTSRIAEAGRNSLETMHNQNETELDERAHDLNKSSGGVELLEPGRNIVKPAMNMKDGSEEIDQPDDSYLETRSDSVVSLDINADDKEKIATILALETRQGVERKLLLENQILRAENKLLRDGIEQLHAENETLHGSLRDASKITNPVVEMLTDKLLELQLEGETIRSSIPEGASSDLLNTALNDILLLLKTTVEGLGNLE